MTGVKISGLDQVTVLAEGDLLPVVDISDTAETASGKTVRATVGVLAEAVADINGGVADVGDLADVDLTGLGDGDGLTYDSDTSTWQPAALLPITPGSPAAGDVLTYDSDTTSYTPTAVPTPNPFNFAATCHPAQATAATVLGASNRTYFMKVLYGPKRGCTTIQFRPGTNSGNIAVGLARRGTGVGTADTPGSIVVTSGSIAYPASGAVTFVDPFDVELGDWLFVSCDNNTAQFYAFLTAGGVNEFHLGCHMSGAFNPGLGAAPLSAAESKGFGLVAY